MTRYARDPRVLWRSTSRGPVVLRPDDEQPKLLSGVGAAVWEALDHPAELEPLRQSAVSLGVPAPTVGSAIAALVDAGLILAE